MTSMSVGAPHSSPWLSAWFKPRQAIASVVATNPRRHVWLLAALGMICTIAAQRTFTEGIGALLSWSSVAAVILAGAIIGVINLYCSGLFLRLSGKLFGGQASYAQVRASLAWSQLPIILGVLLGLAQLVFSSSPTAVSHPTR